MNEWWTYRPASFLLFAPRTYWRLFELHNTTWWPLPLLMPVLFIAVLGLALHGRGRPVLLLLALIWAFVGWSFVLDRYAAINWAAAYTVPLFALQAAVLALAAFRSDLLKLDRAGAARGGGVALVTGSIVAYPLLAPLQGRAWTGAEIVGLAPDPTVLATLGLLLISRGPLRRWLMPIPLLWCVLSAVTLATMGAVQAVVPACAGLLAPAALRRAR